MKRRDLIAAVGLLLPGGAYAAQTAPEKKTKHPHPKAHTLSCTDKPPCGGDGTPANCKFERHTLAMALLLTDDTYRACFTSAAQRQAPFDIIDAGVWQAYRDLYSGYSSPEKRSFNKGFGNVGEVLLNVVGNLYGGSHCPSPDALGPLVPK
jgi:hypothetical protein